MLPAGLLLSSCRMSFRDTVQAATPAPIEGKLQTKKTHCTNLFRCLCVCLCLVYWLIIPLCTFYCNFFFLPPVRLCGVSSVALLCACSHLLRKRQFFVYSFRYVHKAVYVCLRLCWRLLVSLLPCCRFAFCELPFLDNDVC